VILQVLELFRSLEGAITHGCDDIEIGRQRAQCHFEADLVVARSRTAVRHHGGLERQCHLRNGLRLQHALGSYAEGV
jgi:hypothetical protein